MKNDEKETLLRAMEYDRFVVLELINLNWRWCKKDYKKLFEKS